MINREKVEDKSEQTIRSYVRAVDRRSTDTLSRLKAPSLKHSEQFCFDSKYT